MLAVTVNVVVKIEAFMFFGCFCTPYTSADRGSHNLQRGADRPAGRLARGAPPPPHVWECGGVCFDDLLCLSFIVLSLPGCYLMW